MLQRAAESYPSFSTLVPYCLLYHALIRHRYSIFDLKVIISEILLLLKTPQNNTDIISEVINIKKDGFFMPFGF